MVDIIERKRDGHALSEEEIRFFVSGYVSGEIPDYQTAALLMAIYLNGMTDRETSDLTLEMAKSGDTEKRSRTRKKKKRKKKGAGK